MAIHAANPEKSEQLRLILHALKFGPVSTLTLQEATGSMCPATRVSELRNRGYNIICERKNGIYFYSMAEKVAKAA